MSFFSNLKRALGFGSKEYDYDEDAFGEDATVQPLVRRRKQNEEQAAEQSAGITEQPVDPVAEDFPSVPVDTIFNTVVATFNEALPGFLGRSSNPEAQRQQLYDALDADIKTYLESLKQAATDHCSRSWERERNRIEEELRQLRDKSRSHEESAAEKNTQFLSIQRQKRALKERIHDLEGQVTALEAEKEQYQLENRSLVNKLRVSNLINDGAELPDIAEFEKRIDQAKADGEKQVAAAKAECENLIAAAKTECENQVAAAKTECEKLIAEKSTLEAATSEHLAQLASLQEQLRVAREQVSALTMKTEMTDVMLNDLNRRASTASHDADARLEEIETLRAGLKDALAENDNLRAELDDARTNLEIASRIQSEIERIHQLIDKKNNVINDLNEQLRRRDDRIHALEVEEKSLRSTIENNLLQQAESESRLRAEIESLGQQIAGSSRERGKSRRRSSVKISAIDDDIDNTDWLVATPPEGTAVKTSGVPDAEFGYREPQRKTPPENSAQMSLW